MTNHYQKKLLVICSNSKWNYDDTANSCVLIQTNSKCGVGTMFDDTTNSCVLAGTQTNSKCGVGTMFDE